MSRVNNLRGTNVTILLGDGGDPVEAFDVLCGITTKSLTSTTNTTDAFNRDCEDPDDVPVRELIATGRQWSLRGSGQMNRDNIADLDDAEGQVRNYRFFIGAKPGEAAALNGYYGGPGMLVTKTINGDDGGYVGVDIAIESHGQWTWTPVAIV